MKSIHFKKACFLQFDINKESMCCKILQTTGLFMVAINHKCKVSLATYLVVNIFHHFRLINYEVFSQHLFVSILNSIPYLLCFKDGYWRIGEGGRFFREKQITFSNSLNTAIHRFQLYCLTTPNCRIVLI